MDVMRNSTVAIAEKPQGSCRNADHAQKQAPEALQKVFAMAKGEGDGSYSKNSKAQAHFNTLQKSVLLEALERVVLPSEEGSQGGPLVVVADLGSSSSANSIDNVALIVDKLRLRLSRDAEFQVYFNDLPSNDFNLLFQLLTQEDRTHSFFAAGVPGSFYDRLFPQSHAHVFHSSLCLHWLSKIPEELLDKKSPLYNGGNVWYMEPGVAAAYKRQSAQDLRSFLRAREAELHPGGSLFFSLMGRSCSEPMDSAADDSFSRFIMDVNDIWGDLVSEGLLAEEVRESFNFPVYLRSLEEVSEAVASVKADSGGAAFRVLAAKAELVGHTADQLLPGGSVEELGSIHSRICKGVAGGLFEAYAPTRAMDIFWQRFAKVGGTRLAADRSKRINATMITVSLIKNGV